MSLALWNGQDPILKERLFGLTNGEGNHGEDVKECYYYLDATPTHSYMKMLYKYPQRAFPYTWLVEENRRRGKGLPEFELVDTNAFDEDRYFDVFIEYAKESVDGFLMSVAVHNRSSEEASVHVLPQLWFRNTWPWGNDEVKPVLQLAEQGVVSAVHPRLGNYFFYADVTLAQWSTVIGVNLTGQFLCAREAVREFKRRGIVRETSVSCGKIICMSSVHEVIPWAGHVNYAASKGGVMLLMKSIAQEVAPFRIRVNSICPGAIRTPINTQAWDTLEAYSSLMTLIPYKRIGEPEDIGRAAVFLASDQADYINGASIFVDGGMTLYPGFATGG